MNTGRIVFEQTSQKSVSQDRILQVTLEALREGDFITALDQFNDEFAFIDHALELEFSAKDRLTEFFTKRRRLFTGASIVQIENGKITQWSDYYDQLQSGGYGLGTLLTAWFDA